MYAITAITSSTTPASWGRPVSPTHVETQMEAVSASQDLQITAVYALSVPLEHFGAHLPVSASSSAVKTQHTLSPLPRVSATPDTGCTTECVRCVLRGILYQGYTV